MPGWFVFAFINSQDLIDNGISLSVVFASLLKNWWGSDETATNLLNLDTRNILHLLSFRLHAEKLADHTGPLDGEAQRSTVLVAIPKGHLSLFAIPPLDTHALDRESASC